MLTVHACLVSAAVCLLSSHPLRHPLQVSVPKPVVPEKVLPQLATQFRGNTLGERGRGGEGERGEGERGEGRGGEGEREGERGRGRGRGGEGEREGREGEREGERGRGGEGGGEGERERGGRGEDESILYKCVTRLPIHLRHILHVSVDGESHAQPSPSHSPH